VAKRFVVLVVLALAAAMAAPASADGNKMSIGYAYLKSLESGGGSVPLGAFLSFGPGDDSGLELDFGFHHDKDASSNEYTGAFGPRFPLTSGGESSVFLHAMGLAAYDRAGGSGEWAFGGMGGLGADLGFGSSAQLRLAADFRLLFHDGDNFKSLRLGIGLTF
jgi:hypothetical protein